MNQNEQEFLVQKIRTQYTEKEYTKLDELKALDRKVKKPADVGAFVFGTISAIIMGSGMSLIMTDLSDVIGVTEPLKVGLIVGIMGMFGTVINYPGYKRILNSRRKKYAEQIVALSNTLLQK